MAATRRAILDALVHVLAEGVDELTIPAVADRAGVSVGTVYRHFGNKSGLVDALSGHVTDRTGIRPGHTPRTLQDMDEMVHEVFTRLAAADAQLVAALATGVGRAASDRTVPDRINAFREAFASIDPNLDDDDVHRLAQVGLLLTSSTAVRLWREQLGLSADEAADTVMWTIRHVLEGLS